MTEEARIVRHSTPSLAGGKPGIMVFVALMLAGSGLALVLQSLAATHAFVFDYDFGALAWMLAACGLAVGTGISARRLLRKSDILAHAAVQGAATNDHVTFFPWLKGGNGADILLLASATATIFAVFLPFVLPLDSVLVWLVIAGAAVLPFACAAAAMQRLHQQSAAGLPSVLIPSLAGAVLVLPWLAQLFGNTLRAGGAGALTLAGAALLLSRGRRLPVVVIVALIIAGVPGYLLHVFGSAPSPQWSPESPYTFHHPAAETGGDLEAPRDRVGSEKRFPLLALTFEAREPQRVLIIGPEAASATQVARAFAVPQVEVFAGPETTTTLAEAREHLRERAETADLFILIGTQGSPNNRWISSDPRDAYLWTTEAFEIYWRALAPGGVLAVVTRDEAVFTRALLTVRELFAKSAGQGVMRLWGLRLLPMGVAQEDHQYLLLAEKSPALDTTGNRIVELAMKLPVSGLFGPGFGALQYYTALYDPRGPEVAGAVLTEAMSYRARTRAEISPTSDLRPYAFSIVREAHPFTRVLLGVGVLLLIIALMLPLPELRTIDAVRNASHLPLPVYLGFFVLLGLCAAILFVGLARQSAPFLPSLFDATTLVGLALAVGVLVGRIVSQRSGGSLFVWGVALAALMLVVWLMFCVVSETVFDWPPMAVLLLTVALGLVGGFLMVLAAYRAAGLFVGELTELLPWASVVGGLAALVGAIAVNWLARLYGWSVVWPMAAICAVVAGALPLRKN